MGVSNQKIMWAVSAVFLLLSSYLGYSSYSIEPLPELDTVEEWNGTLPELNKMDGSLSGQNGIWLKSSFFLNEGEIGDFSCYGAVLTTFQDRERKLIEAEQNTFNITIAWDDPESDDLYIMEGWIDLHPELELKGISNSWCSKSGGTIKSKAQNVNANEGPIPLRGLFLALESGNENVTWYLVSVGYDEDGGFNVEPYVDDTKFSDAMWATLWGVIGFFILYSSFDPRNKG